MGWFSSSSPTPLPSSPEPSKDGGYIAPDRTARQNCYETRDAFFACLDRNSIIDSVKDDALAKKHCLPEMRAFEGGCAESWVTYFKKRRVFEWQKEETIRKLEAQGATGYESGAPAKALRGTKG